MFEGVLDDGELEIGLIAGLIHDVKSVAEIVANMVAEFEEAKQNITSL
jgi:enoyl-[acyl-carrier protein] reductase II